MSRGCNLVSRRLRGLPRLRDQFCAVSPTLYDSILKPILLQVCMIHDDDLQLRCKFIGSIGYQLEQQAHRSLVFIAESIDRPFWVPVGGIVCLRRLIEQDEELPAVVSFLRYLGRHDYLRLAVHRRLRIVALHLTALVGAIGRDTALRIGEVALRLRIRFGLLRIRHFSAST